MGKRKQYTGIVISDKMRKTRIVKIMRVSKHAEYDRVIKKFNKFKVHDEKDITKSGDTVRIEETRPISKDKHYRLVEIIKKSQAPHVELKEEPK